MNFIFTQTLFFISLALVLFFPGYFLLLAVFGKSKILSILEKFILSFGLGMIITEFTAFLYNKINLPITAWSSIIGILMFSAVCFVIYKIFEKNKLRADSEENETKKLFSFSKKQFFLILLLLFFTIFIKTVYLTGTAAPTATDLGHHTYWIKLIATTHKLTDYEGMPDFIIGEHVALAEIFQITGASYFSALSMIFLFLIDMLGILTVFILTLRMFKNKFVAILSMLFLGALFAVSSPQAKFVSGGVMGNIIGNYLTPLVFYFYYRALEFLKNNSSNLKVQLPSSRNFLSLAVFATVGLFYTHHLTAFIFLFVFAFLIIFYLTINFRDIKNITTNVWKVVWSPQVIGTLILCLVFFFWIFTPSYVKVGAVDTAVGAPSKASRTGLNFNNLKSTVGEARAALGLLGLLLIALYYKGKRKDVGLAIALSWAAMIFIMSTFPHLLLINLPSDRIGNYLTYPLAILSAFGFYYIFKPELLNLKIFSDSNAARLITGSFIKGFFVILLVFALNEGLADSVQVFKKAPDFTPMNETFDVSEYLAKNVSARDVILKDHNYLSADTWMKIFFMDGYNYPLSRGVFSRYNDPTKPREMCTLQMISQPATESANACFAQTQTDFIAINPLYDSSQFQKLDNFNKIYATDGVVVFYRK